MQLNERCREALQITINKHNECLTFLHRHHQFPEGDVSDDAHVCKTVAIMLADNLCEIEHLHKLFYAWDENTKKQVAHQVEWRCNSITWLIKKFVGCGRRTDQLLPYVEDACNNYEYAIKLLEQNPEDYVKFDRALDFIKKRMRVTDTDPNDGA